MFSCSAAAAWKSVGISMQSNTSFQFDTYKDIPSDYIIQAGT